MYLAFNAAIFGQDYYNNSGKLPNKNVRVQWINKEKGKVSTYPVRLSLAKILGYLLRIIINCCGGTSSVFDCADMITFV